MIETRLVAALVVIGLGFLAGWTVQGWRMGVAEEIYRKQAAEALAQAQSDAKAQSEAWQHDVAEIDERYSQELSDAQETISDLRAQLERGARQLRVAAHCPKHPDQTGAAGVDDGQACQLDASARSDYLDLRAGMQRQLNQLLACQEFIRAACQ